ncbi:hypothetical protein J6590_013792 [Homalodisca vitripennis]|nr:hypothetical protein J6590_013792 [Homalodisca vitripennis]
MLSDPKPVYNPREVRQLPWHGGLWAVTHRQPPTPPPRHAPSVNREVIILRDIQKGNEFSPDFDQSRGPHSHWVVVDSQGCHRHVKDGWVKFGDPKKCVMAGNLI